MSSNFVMFFIDALCENIEIGERFSFCAFFPFARPGRISRSIGTVKCTKPDVPKLRIKRN